MITVVKNKSMDSVNIRKLFNLCLIYIIIITSLILIIIPILLPLGFSPDTLNYYITIDLPPRHFNFLSFEPFYWLIVYINQILFNSNWNSFLLFFSVVYVGLSTYLIIKHSISPAISFIIFVLLYYPNFGLIQIRNGISIAIIWWAFFDWIEGKKWKFVIKSILATLFHYSSVIFLILILVNKNRINKKFYFLLPIFGLLLGQYIFKIEFYNLIINYLPTFLKAKAQSYLYLKMYGPEDISLNKINIFNFYSLFTLIIYYFSLMINLNDDKYLINYQKIIGFAIFFWFSFKVIPVFSFRVSNEFLTFIVFLIPYIFNKFKKNQRNLVYFLLFLTIVLLSWNMYIRHNLFDFSLF